LAQKRPRNFSGITAVNASGPLSESPCENCFSYMPLRSYEFWPRHPGINWRRYEAIDMASIRFELTSNGESVLFGGMAIVTMWKLSTITKRGEK